MKEFEKWLDKQIEEDKLPEDRPFDVEEGWKAALEWAAKQIQKDAYSGYRNILKELEK